VVVLNTGETWPYVMTDSQGEARATPVGLHIAVVMVSGSDGERLLRVLDEHSAQPTCRLLSSRASRECVICQDAYAVGALVIKLPCSHLFHEKCISSWLLRHSGTCPTCRRDCCQPLDNNGRPAPPQWADWFG
jgi:Ring finger domain